MDNLQDTTEYSNITSEIKSDTDIIILPLKGKRRGRIIIEANYKNSETKEEIQKRNEMVLKILLKGGLNKEIEKLNM